MAWSLKQNKQNGRWDEATWAAIGMTTGAALGVVFGGGAGIAIGVPLGAGFGIAVATWRTHHGPGPTS